MSQWHCHLTTNTMPNHSLNAFGCSSQPLSQYHDLKVVYIPTFQQLLWQVICCHPLNKRLTWRLSSLVIEGLPHSFPYDSDSQGLSVNFGLPSSHFCHYKGVLGWHGTHTKQQTFFPSRPKDTTLLRQNRTLQSHAYEATELLLNYRKEAP